MNDGVRNDRLRTASNKLAGRLLVASGLTAILTGVSFLAYETVSYQRDSQRELDRQAGMMSVQVSAALDFGDLDSAQTILGSLAAADNIRVALLCDERGRLLVSTAAIDDKTKWTCSRPSGGLVARHRVESMTPSDILLLGRDDLVTRRLLRATLVVMLFIALSMVLALALSRGVRRTIAALLTRQRITEQNLADARDRAEIAAGAKSTFLANMSHEIRTPLNGMVGTVQLLLDSALDSDQRMLTSTLRASADSLLAIVNDILDLSKIEAGRLELDPQPVVVKEFVATTAAMFQSSAAAKGLYVRMAIAADVPEVVSVDPVRLRQILSNLVSNAIKFTHQGGVQIRLTVSEHPDKVCFEVEDTGIGVPAERVHEIFSRFEQADSSTTRAYGGTGLGLAIARELTRMMGGSMDLRSDERARGSTFSFCIIAPRTERPEAIDHATPSTPCFELDVLLCEDNAVNAMIARRMLERFGCRVTLVVDGVEAVAATADRTFDLILMDGQMPVMDGYEASRRIKAAGVATRIVALTANVMADDLERCRLSGMVGWVAKPISMRALESALADALPSKQDGCGVSWGRFDLQGEDAFPSKRIDDHVVDARIG